MKLEFWHILEGIAFAGVTIGTGYLVSEMITEDEIPELSKLAIDCVSELAQRSPLGYFEKASVDIVAKTANIGIDALDYHFRR